MGVAKSVGLLSPRIDPVCRRGTRDGDWDGDSAPASRNNVVCPNPGGYLACGYGRRVNLRNVTSPLGVPNSRARLGASLTFQFPTGGVPKACQKPFISVHFWRVYLQNARLREQSPVTRNLLIGGDLGMVAGEGFEPSTFRL